MPNELYCWQVPVAGWLAGCLLVLPHSILPHFLDCRAPRRYGHCVGHCMHGDSCARADCATGRRHFSVHLLSGAVLPLMRRPVWT